MARVSNAKAVDCIRRKEPFDNNSGSLQGRRSFAGWGHMPMSMRLWGKDPEVFIAYWVYSDDTPIAWVTRNADWVMPALLRPTDTTMTQHQGIVAMTLLQTHRLVKG